MIVLDTHAWIWWVHGDNHLSHTQVEMIQSHETDIIGISAISLWEIAKLVQYGRLEVNCSLETWFENALSYPGVQLIELTPAIVIESTRLPGEFHRDPSDQIIVATARISDCSLVTQDTKILSYPFVKLVV